MFLERLKARNFRLLEDFEMEFPSLITVIIGPNNAGKSNVVDLLLFIKESMAAPPMSMLVNRQGFDRVVSRHQVQRSIEIDLVLTESDHGNITYSVACDRHGTLRDEVHMKDYELVGSRQGSNLMYKSGSSSIGGYTGNVSLLPTGHLQLQPLRDFLGSLVHIDPFRAVGLSNSIGPRDMVSATGTDLAQVLHYHYNNDRERFDQYEEVTKRIVPEIDIIETPILGGPTATVSLRFKGDSEKYNLWQISSGLKDVLVLLAAVHFSAPGSLVILEEPENHLHPASQKALATVIREASIKDKKQFIITTHSGVILEQFGPENAVWIDKGDTGAKAVPLIQAPPYLVGHRLGVERTQLLELLKRERQIVVLLEGREDYQVLEPLWKYFEIDSEVLPISVGGGGWQDLVDTAKSLRDAMEHLRFHSRVFILLDNDGQRDQKIAYLKHSGFGEDSHVWQEKEIECYLLLMPNALASVFSKSVEEVQKAIKETRESVRGKAQYEDVLQSLGSKQMPKNVILQHAVTKHPEEIPQEVRSVLNKIRGMLGLPLL